MEPTGSGCPESRGQPKQASLEDAKAFYENLSPKKKPKSVRKIVFPAGVDGGRKAGLFACGALVMLVRREAA